VHLANYAFDGGRADLNKSLSINPVFQVQHSFHLGSQVAPSSYSFGAIFVQGKVRLINTSYHASNVLTLGNLFTALHARER
jgi:mitochondrial import receptor subunit TOM40